MVDDIENLSQTISRVIEKLGYTKPSLFSDGTSLVRALFQDKQAFDVILLDYRMPEMNGIEAAKIIQRYRKEVKLVIVSAYDFVKEKAADIGVRFLQKPFSIEQLEECLNTL